MPFESVIEQIKDSWASYGIAVIVIHPRQFFGTDAEDRWNTYLQMIKWINTNGGKILRAEPPTPRTSWNYHPLIISTGLFVGMVSTLLVVFNLTNKRKDSRVRVRSLPPEKTSSE